MTKKENILLLLLGTFILSIIGLYNGYPLVTSDTGTYIYSGFENVIPLDRPIVYGFMVRHLSLEYSMWFVVFFQNLLMSFVLLEALKIFIVTTSKLKQAFVMIAMGLTFFTGISWYTNQLMPDFFAPILILSIFILLKSSSLQTWKKVLFYSLVLLSCLVHFSHILIGVTLLILLLIRNRKLQIDKKVGVGILCLALSAFLIIPSINYLVEKKFILSKGSHVFLMAHLADNGILDRFLQENCNEPEFMDCTLCDRKDSIPTDLSGFLWTSNMIEKSGGWEGSREEYTKIIHATLTKPDYLFANIFKSFSAGVQQLFRVEIGQGVSFMGEDSPPYGQIKKHLPKELANFKNSKQNQWQGMALKNHYINLVHKLLLIGSMSIFCFLFFSPVWVSLDKTTKFFVVFILVTIVVNSMVTAGLNAPNERFNARVIWMFPFSMIVLLVVNMKTILNHYKAQTKKA